MMKAWGIEQTIINTAEYCGKRFLVYVGRQSSLHYHKQKTETFYVERGALRLEHDDSTTILKPGDSITIPAGTHHRFTGLHETIVFEFSTTHDDADVFRIEPSKGVTC